MYTRREGDDLLNNDNRLKYKWEWTRIASGYSKNQLKNWTHFQSSHCKINGWILEVSQWGGDFVYYQASIVYRGDTITTSDQEYKTRIGAQIGAEKLLMDWIKKQYKEVINGKF